MSPASSREGANAAPKNFGARGMPNLASRLAHEIGFVIGDIAVWAHGHLV